MTNKTLIWDLSGTLTKKSTFKAVSEKLAEACDASAIQIETALKAGEDRATEGKESLLVFWARSIRPLGISYAQFHHEMLCWYDLDTFLIGFIESIADRYDNIIASDSFPQLSDRLRADEGLAVFDAMYFSNELGVSKKLNPARFFDAIIKGERLKPQECIFIDDKEQNHATPQQLGMKTILHTSTPKTLVEIRKAL